jgi:hypothetical protein
LTKLPKALVAATAEGASAAGSAAAAVPSLGVQLLLWHPGDCSTSAASYSRVFGHIAGRWGSSSSAGSMAAVGFAAAAWQTFMQRCA